MIFVGEYNGEYNDEIIIKAYSIECALSINHLSLKLPCIKIHFSKTFRWSFDRKMNGIIN